MEEINEVLAELWGSRITQCNIDIKSHVIEMRFLTQHVDKGPVETKVRFVDTETVCFGVEPLSLDMQSQLMECVSIEVRESDVATLRASFHSNSGDDYMVHPNIIMEVDSSFLAVRAKSIVIDEAIYPLG